MKISLCTEKGTSSRIFVTKSDENHIMSLSNPILDIPIKKEVSFNFQRNGKNFNKLIKSSVKTEGCILFDLTLFK